MSVEAPTNRTGWKRVELCKVGKLVTGSTPSKKRQEFYGGDFPFVKPGELLNCPVSESDDSLSDEGSKVADVVPAGGVLVSCIGNLGKTGLATRSVAFNQQINAIIPYQLDDSKWIFYAVQTPEFAEQLAAASSATTIAIVNKSKFSALLIPVAPLPEQKRIVAKIEKQFTRLEAGIGALKRVQANLKRYRAAVLKAACEGRLVSGDLKIWRKITLGEVVSSMKNGIYKPRNAYAADGIACLRMYNIETGKIVWKNIKRMRLSRNEIKEYGLVPGDLLVNRVNSRELVGKSAAIPQGLEECVFESKNIRVRLKSELADPRFVNFIMSSNGSTYFNRNAQQVVGMASISQPQVAGFPLPLPPLIEQKRIVAEVERRLSVVEELETLVSSNLQRATRLRQSILQKAFEGKLVS